MRADISVEYFLTSSIDAVRSWIEKSRTKMPPRKVNLVHRLHSL